MSDLIVSGKWKCDTCGFVLFKKTLFVKDGAVGTDLNPMAETCPNEGAKMRPYSWKEETEEIYPAYKRLEEMFLAKCEELAVLKKLQQPASSENGGMVRVPKVPTKEMILAAVKSVSNCTIYKRDDELAVAFYYAMLAAAPKEAAEKGKL